MSKTFDREEILVNFTESVRLVQGHKLNDISHP